MEHERGAFKVKLPNRPMQLRNGWKFTGSIPPAAASMLRKQKYRAGILVKSHRVHKN
jgi:hypothetical protein